MGGGSALPGALRAAAFYGSRAGIRCAASGSPCAALAGVCARARAAPAWLWRACVRRKARAARRVQASCFPLLALSFIPQREPQCRQRCGHCAGRRARVLAGCSHMYMHRHDEHRCIFTYTHTHTHTCIHTYTHTYTHTHSQITFRSHCERFLHAHTHTHTHTHTQTHMQRRRLGERGRSGSARGQKCRSLCTTWMTPR